MTWNEIKLELGKKLGDPSGVKYGGVLKNYFRAAYLQYVPTAPLEQLKLFQFTLPFTLSNMMGEHPIPKSCLFINLSSSNFSDAESSKRFIQVTPSAYSLSVTNPAMKPSSSEVMWFRDGNALRVLSNNESITARINYLPDLIFSAIDNSISDDAIAVIMNMVVDTLIPTKAKDEYTNTNK